MQICNSKGWNTPLTVSCSHQTLSQMTWLLWNLTDGNKRKWITLLIYWTDLESTLCPAPAAVLQLRPKQHIPTKWHFHTFLLFFFCFCFLLAKPAKCILHFNNNNKNCKGFNTDIQVFQVYSPVSSVIVIVSWTRWVVCFLFKRFRYIQFFSCRCETHCYQLTD